MDSWNIEIATGDDAASIARIQHDSWLATYPHAEAEITTEDIAQKLGPLEKREENWRRKIENPGETLRTFVVKDGVRVIGFCKVEKKEVENHVDALYLDLAYVGKGAAATVFERALAWLGNEKPITLEVVSYNHRAIEFYERFGFVAAGFGEPHVVVEGKAMPMTIMRRGE